MDHQFTASIFLLILAFLPHVFASNIDYNQLVYKHCENQTSKGDDGLSRLTTISAFFQEIMLESSRSRFFQTNAGDDQMAISGLFQCRGDLSNDSCNQCVKKLPQVSRNLCGSSIPARVQLAGCHIRYQDDAIFQTSKLQLLHKTCSHRTGSNVAIQEQRAAAFAAIQECVQGGQGYCDLNYDESLHLMAQCDGNVEGCYCIECVNNAMDIVQEQCVDSVSAEIYMDGCYISYKYYNNNGINSGSSNDKSGGGNSTKLVAIVIGGIVAVSVAVGLCYFCKSRGKNKDEF